MHRRSVAAGTLSCEPDIHNVRSTRHWPAVCLTQPFRWARSGGVTPDSLWFMSTRQWKKTRTWKPSPPGLSKAHLLPPKNGNLEPHLRMPSSQSGRRSRPQDPRPMANGQDTHDQPTVLSAVQDTKSLAPHYIGV